MTTVNLFLVVLSVVIGVTNALLTSRVAPSIARFFAWMAARRHAAELPPPPPSRRLQPAG